MTRNHNRPPQGAWFLIRVYCVATHIVARAHVKELKRMRWAIRSRLDSEYQTMFERLFLFLISLEAAFEQPSAMLGRHLFYLILGHILSWLCSKK